jgi:hypothetical protein
MIKIKIIIIFLLLPVLAYTQLDSSSFIIRLNGGYADIDLSNGVASLGGVASNTSSWNAGFSLGLVVNKKWEVGLGFDYMKQKTTAESLISVPTLSTMWYAYQITDTKISLFAGKFYLSGYWRLFNYLYFSPVFSTSIGKAKGFQKTLTGVDEYYYNSDSFIIFQGQKFGINRLDRNKRGKNLPTITHLRTSLSMSSHMRCLYQTRIRKNL